MKLKTALGICALWSYLQSYAMILPIVVITKFPLEIGLLIATSVGSLGYYIGYKSLTKK